MISVKVQTPPPFVVALLAVAGSIALILALWSGDASWRLVHGAVRTTGTVVEMTKGTRTGSDRDLSLRDSMAPVFRFRDAAGKEHTVKSKLYSSPPAHRVGDTVPVIYQRSEPEQARIYKFAYLWLLPSISGGFALVFLSIVVMAVCRRLFGRKE